MITPFVAVILRQRKCSECDACEAGLYDRIDCGCVTEVEVGRYARLATARLVAARQASLPGTRQGGRNTGHWTVETDADGVVAYS